MDYERKKIFWSQLCAVALIFTVIMFFVMTSQKDGSNGAVISVIIMLVGMVVTIVSVVKINVYTAQASNMSADEYLSDRFANAIPETKEILGIKDKETPDITVTCPYCKSTNTKKISNVSKAGSVALWGVYAVGKVSKQWHCDNCKSDF